MILIADSGGTKTDWRLIDGPSIRQFVSSGFNPNTHDTALFLNEVQSHFASIEGISEMHFYGAGMHEGFTDFSQGLKKLFPSAKVNLHSDVIGACRSLAGAGPAFVGILGTGSAGCFYDGEKVAIHPPSMGYALGDEGGGADLGRRLVKGYFRNQMSSELALLFEENFHLTKQEVYDRVYKGDKPNAYLASFVPFVLAHRHWPEVHEIILENFRAFFRAYFHRMPATDQYSFHFTGSVAFHFSDYLREIGTSQGYTVGRIVQSPIAGLALYHQAHG